jgi:hypothetical protein
MKSESAMVLVFGATMCFGVILCIWMTAEQGLCGLPMLAETINKGDSCLEFWLNRYQTLIGGFFTLVAAVVAALCVLGQTRSRSDRSSSRKNSLR